MPVTDIHHQPVEDHHFRSLGRRNQHAPLEHVLQQAGCLEADGLATGIGTGYQENMFLGGQGCGQRHDFLVLALERPLEQRMPCLAQIHFPAVGYHRHSGHEIQGCHGLGYQEVQFADAYCTGKQVRDIRPEPVAELVQNPRDFPPFGEMQFAYLVRDFHYFRRLDESRLAG